MNALTRKLLITGMCALAGTWSFASSAGDERASGHRDKMKVMDTNGDGRITSAEHSAGAAKMFEKMDANKDGKVTAAEMQAMHEAKHGSMKHDEMSKQKMSAADKIRTIDADGDGALTAEEHAMGSRKMFSKMDQDSDGNLTAEEMRAGHEKMMGAQDAE